MWDQDGSRILSHWSTRNVAPIPGPVGWRGNRLGIFTGNPPGFGRLQRIELGCLSMAPKRGTQGITTGLCSVSNSKFGGTSESFGWFYNSNIPNVGCLHVYIYYFHHSWNFRISTDQPNLFVFRACSLGCFCSIAPPLLIPATSVSIPVADSWSTIKHQVSHQQHRPLDNTSVDTTPWIYIYITTYITIYI